jgi:hypothetical protein
MREYQPMIIRNDKKSRLWVFFFALAWCGFSEASCKRLEIQSLFAAGYAIEPKVYFNCDRSGVSISFADQFDDSGYDSLYVTEDRAQSQYFARELSLSGRCEKGPVVHVVNFERSVDWVPTSVPERRFRPRYIDRNSDNKIILVGGRIDFADVGLSCDDFDNVEINLEWRHWAPGAKFSRALPAEDWRLVAVVSVGGIKYNRKTLFGNSKVTCEENSMSVESKISMIANEVVSFCLE